jgi:hypothetical protein
MALMLRRFPVETNNCWVSLHRGGHSYAESVNSSVLCDVFECHGWSGRSAAKSNAGE